MSLKCQIFRNDFIISYITVRYISDKNQHSFSRCGFESHERIKINNWDLVVVVRHNPFLSTRILPSPLILPRMFWLQSENTNLRGSIPGWLISCLLYLDSAALLMLNEQQFYLCDQIQTSQTGGQPYNDTSPNGR